MEYYDYGYANSVNLGGTVIWTIIAVILSIVGGILVYFLFLNPKKEVKTSGFVGWLKDFLSFKTMMIESILKVLYLISTILVILLSFNFISTSFVSFLLMIILGPVAVRLAYEGCLMLIMIWKNTAEINKKMK